MDHAERKGSLPDQWYYELGGRVHGPVSRTILEDLLERSGDTALDVRIRLGIDGPWTRYRDNVAEALQESV